MNPRFNKWYSAITLILVVSCITHNAQAIRVASLPLDDVFFYQTPYFHGTHADISNDYASAFQVLYSNGSSRRGANNRGRKTDILDIFCKQNLRYLIDGIPSNEIPSSVNQSLFSELKRLDPNEQLGLVCFKGKFEVDDIHISFRQNFTRGWFFESDLPIKRLRIKQTQLVDASPNVSKDNPQGQAAWDEVKDNLNPILNAFNMCNFNSEFDTHLRVNDARVYVGWQTDASFMYKSLHKALVTARLGLSLPFGKETDMCHPFAIAPGYNGHFGVPFRVDVSFQSKYDIHLGAHLGATLFYDDRGIFRVQTHERQQGMIRLLKRRVGEKMGATFFGGAHIIFDHFIKAFSILAGYTFNVQSSRTLSGVKHPELDECIMNSDKKLRGWDAHVFHFMLEADTRGISQFRDIEWAPFINVFWNYQWSGKNHYSTDSAGFGVGLEIRWALM